MSRWLLHKGALRRWSADALRVAVVTRLGGMAGERPVIRIEDDEQNFIHVKSGRSGKRAIASIAGLNWSDPRHCALTPEEAQHLARFLAAGPDGR